MAIVLVLMGGLVGLAGAMASFVLLDAGVFLALGIWSGVGIVSAILALLPALAPQAATAAPHAADCA